MSVAGAPLRPEDALATLAVSLRDEGPVIAPHVAAAAAPPVLGMLAAAGPRCAADRGSYATVIELVREGYLCHYGEPRLLARLDPDLRLLTGDHLYARGIERLAGLGDLLAVAELSDLISLVAQLDAAPGSDRDAAEIAWLAAAVAIGAGPTAEHAAGKATLRADGVADRLWRAALEQAEQAGLSEHLSVASEAVGFAAPNRG